MIIGSQRKVAKVNDIFQLKIWEVNLGSVKD